MRLVFVNHYAPDAPHVGAVRLREFARVLAARGHQVVLLTETLGGHGQAPPPHELSAMLAASQWSAPLALPCAPRPSRLLAALRAGTLPRPVRAAMLATLYEFHGGVFPDWSAGVAAHVRILADRFRPDAVWATFGNTEAWLIARSLAHRARCPWVMDVKDPWDVFIPAPFRRPLARRFAGAAAATALSAAHAENVRRHFGREAVVVRSGFTPEPPPQAAPFRLLLGGSLYGGEHLSMLADGIRRWVAGLPTGERPVLTYAGGEATRLAPLLDGLDCPTELCGFVPLEVLRRMQGEAVANLYIRNPQALYQHKLLELLSAGRPVVCLPEETGEGRDLAVRAMVPLWCCGDADAVAAALDRAWTSRAAPPSVSADFTAEYCWEGQAVVLERVFRGLTCG